MAREHPNVLIIEDDYASAEALGMIVRDWGADVTLVADADGFDQIPAERLGALKFVITDFHLGDGPDGVMLATRIAERAPDTRVLVLSGSFHGKAAVAAQAAGYEMMQKPARADAIVAWLNRP